MRKVNVLILCVIVLLITSCTKPPIKVAFVGGLTGDLSELGICSRNTFLMGIDKVNAEGGIGGRKIEVVVFDDGNNPERIPEVYEEIRAKDIEIVVGHMVSSLADAVLKEAAKGDVLIVSGTISTTKAKGIDDYFVRTSPTTDQQSIALTKAIEADGVKELLIINDARNLQFVEDISSRIINALDIEATIIDYVPYQGHEDIVIEKFTTKKFDGVLLSVPAEEAAFLSQLVKKENQDVSLYGISWAKDQALIEAGGSAVEGMKFSYRFTDPSKTDLIDAFYKDYEEMYGEPSIFKI